MADSKQYEKFDFGGVAPRSITTFKETSEDAGAGKTEENEHQYEQPMCGVPRIGVSPTAAHSGGTPVLVVMENENSQRKNDQQPPFVIKTVPPPPPEQDLESSALIQKSEVTSSERPQTASEDTPKPKNRRKKKKGRKGECCIVAVLIVLPVALSIALVVAVGATTEYKFERFTFQPNCSIGQKLSGS